MAETPEYVVITKACVGSLTLTLQNPVTGVISRIILRADEPKRMVPVATAALVYTDMYSGAFRMYKDGYFTFDKPEVVYNYAYEHGMIIGDPEICKQSVTESYLDDIAKAILSGNKDKIEEFCKTDKGCEDLARVAREHVGELRQSMIKYIEEKIGVPLTVEGEA